MPDGDGAAAFKGIADGADEALGNAGHALGDFVETTAQTADKTTDAMLATEEQNTQAIAKVMSSGAASQERSAASAAETAGAGSGAPGRISGILDPQGATGDGWQGEGGLHLSPEENAAADRFLAQAKDAESNITPVVMGIRDEVPGAETVGYPDFVLKSPESFKRKFAEELSESPTRDVDSALADMKDSVRYTFKLPGEGTAYTDGVNTALRRFQDVGVENVKFKNTWDRDDYKGINSFWRDPRTGHVFEMQFHTQESFDAKMVTHELYEQARIPGVPEARVQELKAEQNQIFGTVPRPIGATDIALPGR
ncbi:MAG TPA: hypothetical protein VGZ32_18130 [Actinocrinis sp.]|uniref:hypothetical protein n=1 Tax=Actinocrinis sp. TaxID=1920516 RepID=UPI002DDD93C6|nr:hypothetical protein [Actinocrinis sp.]HEV3172272.1 hypothetical protein [Actinocrinis sp.]